MVVKTVHLEPAAPFTTSMTSGKVFNLNAPSVS